MQFSFCRSWCEFRERYLTYNLPWSVCKHTFYYTIIGLYRYVSCIQKKLLHLWTESPKKQSWSLAGGLPSIAADLARIRYPTTTVRVPRSIVKCMKLKANECRVLLLTGYPIFKNYLSDTYYQHLQKLAFGISIGESYSISTQELEEMESLLNSFVDDFPYPERYIVQTVHSVKHFTDTTKDFGPLSNYSTFNYESVIGEIGYARRAFWI